MKVIGEFAGLIVHSNGVTVQVPINVSFIYDPEADPLSVTAMFYHLDSGTEPVEWTFSRELLDAGIASPVLYGPGDVRFREDGDRVIMAMGNPNGYAEVSLHYQTVFDFLLATFGEVRLGEEDLGSSLDAELERIFNS